MFNIEESWNTSNAFPFPLPHHSIMGHFGDMLKHLHVSTLNRGVGEGGSHFPLKTLEYFKDFSRGFSEPIEKITSDFKHVSVTLKLLDRITPDFP